MSSFAFAWRDYEPDMRWCVFCECGHASQIHTALGCTAGPHSYPCLCGAFKERNREWVGPASERPT